MGKISESRSISILLPATLSLYSDSPSPPSPPFLTPPSPSLRNNITAWLRMFQELNAHSVYHLLPRLEQPTLIVSGALDTITPAMVSVEMARRIPHVRKNYFFFSPFIRVLDCLFISHFFFFFFFFSYF